MADANNIDTNTLGPKGSGLKFPTTKRLCDASYGDDYLSLFHPYLLERRKVETPFGVGICRRDAFRPSISSLEESSVDERKSTSASPAPVKSHQQKSNTSKISVSAGACGRGYVVRSGAGSLGKKSSETEPVQRSGVQERPSVERPKSITASGTPVNRCQSRSQMSNLSISAGTCGRGFVIRSDGATPGEQSWSCDLNKPTGEANSNTRIGVGNPGRGDYFPSKDTPTIPVGKSLERQVVDSLAQVSLSKDQLIADDMAVVRGKHSPKNITTIDVRVCHSKNAHPESIMTYSPKAFGCKGLSSAAHDCTNNAQSGSKFGFEDLTRQKRIPMEYSVTKCTAYTSEPRLCYGKRCRVDTVSPSATSHFAKGKDYEANTDQTKNDVIKIGSNVRILAHPDPRQPSFSVGRPRFINAVVTYVTIDGKYKLGTIKGVIGRLFRREELQPLCKGTLSTKEVPFQSITVREASTMSYATLD